MGKILIVDDNDDIQVLLKKFLSMKGYDIAQAKNGVEAKEYLETENHTCIVLLDLMMPVMSGQEFLEWKNNDKEFKDLPVLVVSAQPEEHLQGTVGVMAKPVNMKELYSVVAHYCSAS
jgi:CheY-like chemotaxis protein